MSTEMDAGKGRAVGSHIRMRGRILGFALDLDEVVTVHEPPTAKEWQTVGTPTLLVIGHYRMGVNLQPIFGGVHLNIFIDYEFPERGWTYWLGRLFGGMYARWCVKKMLEGVVIHFVPPKRIVTGAVERRPESPESC